MGKHRSSLEDDLRAVFERACDEQDFQVAEQLLHALEICAQRGENEEELRRIYSKIASTLRNSH